MANNPESPLLTELYDSCVFAAFDKQRQLDRLYSQSDWSYSTDDGLLVFDRRYKYQAQVLGSESDVSNTWLWGWANSSVPPELTGVAGRLRELGEEQQIPELTKASLPLDPLDGHYLSLLACGLTDAKAYYRGPYEDGAAYLVIVDERFPHIRDELFGRIRLVVHQALRYRPIANHRKAFARYLEYLGLSPESDGATLRVWQGDNLLEATFDEQNRLLELHTP